MMQFYRNYNIQHFICCKIICSVSIGTTANNTLYDAIPIEPHHIMCYATVLQKPQHMVVILIKKRVMSYINEISNNNHSTVLHSHLLNIQQNFYSHHPSLVFFKLWCSFYSPSLIVFIPPLLVFFKLQVFLEIFKI